MCIMCGSDRGRDRERERRRKRKWEAVWEEAAMLDPRRDWEGEGSLLTEWIFKEVPHLGGGRGYVSVTVCVWSRTKYNSTPQHPSLFFLSFYCANLHKCPPYTTSSPMTDSNPPAIGSIVSVHTRKALLIALSHPLTINGRPGFRRSGCRRKEGGLEGRK